MVVAPLRVTQFSYILVTTLDTCGYNIKTKGGICTPYSTHITSTGSTAAIETSSSTIGCTAPSGPCTIPFTTPGENLVTNGAFEQPTHLWRNNSKQISKPKYTIQVLQSVSQNWWPMKAVDPPPCLFMAGLNHPRELNMIQESQNN